MASLPKLTSEQVDGLVAAYRNGASSILLATTHNVTVPTVLNYMRRRGVPIRPRGRPRIHAIREDYFEKIGEEQAYWLGFIQGDGYVNKSSVTVALRRSDEPHLVQLRAAIGSTQPITRKLNTGFGKGHPQSTLHLCSTKLVQSLGRVGIRQNKTFDSAFPHFLDRELHRHWLRGLFDADGCVSRATGKPMLVFSLGGYEPVMRDCRDYLVREVAASEVKIARVKAASDQYRTFQYGGINIPRAIYYHLYEDATIYLPRKREVFEQCFRDREIAYGEIFVPAGIRVPIEVLASQVNIGLF